MSDAVLLPSYVDEDTFELIKRERLACGCILQYGSDKVQDIASLEGREAAQKYVQGLRDAHRCEVPHA